jgi:hypothetical protein
MAGDSGMNVQGLWQAQAREGPTMSMADIRAKAERFEARTRRWRTIGALAVIAIAIGNILEAIFETTALERLGALLTLAAIAYITYEFGKHERAAKAEGAGLNSGVAFYRAQLVRQQDITRQSARFLLPFVPGVALSVFGGIADGLPAVNIIGIAACAVALFGVVAWLNARTTRQLQEEIDALDA